MKFALIGEKLPHSYSKEIHEAFGLNYTLNEVEKGGVERFFKENDYDGFNVTIPYKIEVIKYIDKLSETAARVGSVNTVKRVDGKYYGYNTDVGGMRYMLKRAGVGVKDKTVLILGSGGTSLTARALCDEDGAKKYYVVSRSGEINYDNCYALKGVQIIINCTPVGMYPKNLACPIDIKKFLRLCGVADMIYNPAKTRLLLDAERLGIKCINGLSMLVAQAKRASEIFLGTEIDDGEIDRICSLIEKNTGNIVLVGMPGCGKSTIADLIAKATGRRLVDTDTLICEREGCPIPEIFASHGEDYFRACESRAAAESGKMSGCVIATGGGIVTREENLDSLRQNGKIFFIRRDISLLSRDGRPLSATADLDEMYAKRLPKYLEFADFTVDNVNTPEDCAGAIISIYTEE